MNRQHLAAAVLMAIPTAMSLPAMQNTAAQEGQTPDLQFCAAMGCTIYEHFEFFFGCMLTGPAEPYCEALAIS